MNVGSEDREEEVIYLRCRTTKTVKFVRVYTEEEGTKVMGRKSRTQKSTLFYESEN